LRKAVRSVITVDIVSVKVIIEESIYSDVLDMCMENILPTEIDLQNGVSSIEYVIDKDRCPLIIDKDLLNLALRKNGIVFPLPVQIILGEENKDGDLGLYKMGKVHIYTGNIARIIRSRILAVDRYLETGDDQSILPEDILSSRFTVASSRRKDYLRSAFEGKLSKDLSLEQQKERAKIFINELIIKAAKKDYSFVVAHELSHAASPHRLRLYATAMDIPLSVVTFGLFYLLMQDAEPAVNVYRELIAPVLISSLLPKLFTFDYAVKRMEDKTDQEGESRYNIILSAFTYFPERIINGKSS